MYTSEKSTKLTLFVTYGFCALLAFFMVTIYPFVKWILGSGTYTGFSVVTCVVTFYACCPAGWVALVSIIKLLKNVLKDRIFTESTVKTLRIISWCCAYVCAVSFVSFFFNRLFIIFSLGAGLMMLILRVLKNVMAKAVEIKNENEFTI